MFTGLNKYSKYATLRCSIIQS